MVTIAFLTSRGGKSDEDDCKKLERIMSYVHNTLELKLKLSVKFMNSIKWWIDALYRVRQDVKSHTDGSLSLGRGVLFLKSTKQKLNSKSSKEVELLASSEVLSKIL